LLLWWCEKMDDIEIPITISARGKDVWKIDEEIFGKFPDKDQPNVSRYGGEKEIQEGIKLIKKNYTLKASVEAWQDIHVYLEIAKSVGWEVAIGVAGYYMISALRKFVSKIRIGDKDIQMDSDKDEIIKAMKEEMEKLRKDLEKK